MSEKDFDEVRIDTIGANGNIGLHYIQQGVIRTLCDFCGMDEADVTTEATLAGDLRMDSLDMLETVMAIEDDLAIQIEDCEIENIKTVQNIIELVCKKKGI